MLRAGLAAGSIFIIAALLGMLYDPVRSWLNVRELAQLASEFEGVEQELISSGPGATQALHNGLRSKSTLKRIRCARVLALMNNEIGQETLLVALRNPQDKKFHPMIANMLLSIWDQRAGPSQNQRTQALRAIYSKSGDEPKTRLDRLLELSPSWAGGYLARARFHFRKNELLLARQDAIRTLLIEPSHFEAIVLLAQCHQLLDRPGLASRCFEQATAIHPDLYPGLKADIKKANKAAAALQRHRRILVHKYKPSA